MAVRVLVADDNEIMREGICALLRKCDGIEVVGQAVDGRMAVAMASKMRPDLMIIDVEMPNLNGIEATRQMIGLQPNLKVMALSAHAEGDLVAKMIKAGARGYMHKASAFSELKEGIRMMLEGETFLCSRISEVSFSNCVNMILNPIMSETDELQLFYNRNIK
ncbi:MAG: response regulator transcription factor [Anaerohalosphaeraceae bacterium]